MSIRTTSSALCLAALFSVSGCLAPRAVDLGDKSCPCAEGWDCDTATDTCVPSGSGGRDGGASDTGGGGDTGGVTDSGGAGDAVADSMAMDTSMMMPGATNIWLEAEDGMIQGPMAASADAMASGGSYVSSPTGAPDVAVPGPDGRLRLSVTIPAGADGTYRVWGRVITGAMAADPNSFWVCMDVEPPSAAGCTNWNTIQGDATWVWDDVHADVATPIDFTLTAGSHNLDIYYREAGTQLDKVLITDDLAFTPTGMGG